LAVHKAGIEEASAAAGASLLYLRRHGPDLHRIERFLAKLKALLADTGEPPFSVPGDWQHVGEPDGGNGLPRMAQRRPEQRC
jgi:hypothetical protein